MRAIRAIMLFERLALFLINIFDPYRSFRASSLSQRPLVGELDVKYRQFKDLLSSEAGYERSFVKTCIYIYGNIRYVIEKSTLFSNSASQNKYCVLLQGITCALPDNLLVSKFVILCSTTKLPFKRIYIYLQKYSFLKASVRAR